jgi:hypothetical protein
MMSLKFDSIDPVALYAAILSTVIAVIGAIRYYLEWRAKYKEKSKIEVNADHLIVHNQKDGRRYDLIQLLVANLGREPVIIREVVARGPNQSSHPGWFKEPAATYGIRDQILPKELKPAESIELPLFYLALFKNQVDEIAVVDSYGREFKVSEFDLQRLRKKAEELLSEKNKPS